jgi:hypothetical protein
MFSYIIILSQLGRLTHCGAVYEQQVDSGRPTTTGEEKNDSLSRALNDSVEDSIQEHGKNNDMETND